MSIKVISTSIDSTEAAKAEQAPVAKEPVEPSAPEAENASDENESSESDTEEKEAKESTDETEDKESEEDTESKDSEEEKPKRKGGFQKRIDKLNARVTERERELEYWKSQALKGAGEPDNEKVETRNVPAAADGKPNPDNFDTHSEYVEALTDWKVEQKQIELDRKREKSRLEIEQENILKSHTKRVKSFAEKNEDFSDVLADVDDIPVSATLQELIITSENGPELIYELAKNREEFERISKLSPLAAARELGRIETRLASSTSSEKKPEPKKTTNAPRPLEPVGKGTSGPVRKDLSDPNLSQTEYERIRREQMRKRQA